MPNFSGVWTLKEHGVAVKGDRWQVYLNNRGLFGGGYASSIVDTIQYIDITSTGDATDFGDLLNTSGRGAGCSDHTRGITFLGQNPANNNIIEVVTIQTTGNSKDFGDRSFASHSNGALSNGHGGLP